jgi:hypothetical protein
VKYQTEKEQVNEKMKEKAPPSPKNKGGGIRRK